MRLKVGGLESDDLYRDRIRLHRHFRGGIRVGRICRLATPYRSTLVEVRGKVGDPKEVIYMDQATRQRLGLVIGSVEEFSLQPAGWLRQFIWAANASDPV